MDRLRTIADYFLFANLVQLGIQTEGKTHSCFVNILQKRNSWIMLISTSCLVTAVNLFKIQERMPSNWLTTLKLT